MPEQIIKLRKKTKKELKKIVILTNIREIINKLLGIMKNHTGEENKISRYKLFEKVYNLKVEEVTELQEWLMWEMIKKSLHRMRQRTHCFVISKQFPISQYSSKYQGIWHYWVANSPTDYIIYRDNINRNIKAMKRMVQKCNRSINNSWYKEDWTYK